MSDEKITGVTREFKKALQTKVTSALEVKLVPSGQALGQGALAVQPCLILQGPEIQLKEDGRDFTIDSEFKEVVGGVNVNTIKKVKVWVNLLYRVRLFDKSQVGILDWLTKLIGVANELTEITFDGDEYNVYMDSNFDPDTVPNFSDLKHYEGTAVIEDLYIQTSVGEDVYEVKSATEVDMEKKED